MIPENPLLTSFINNNNIVSTCDFISERINVGRIIYEVVRVIDGKPLFFEEHLERFFNSIINTGFVITLSKKSISLRIKALVEVNKLKEGNIRFQLSFVDDIEPIFTAWVTPFIYPKKELYDKGVLLTIMEAERKNPTIKTYNPKLKDKVSSQIFQDDIYEVLLVNNNGMITEGSRSNIFFVKGSTILTPLSTSVLPGITRQKVMDIAKNCGISCSEVDIEYNSIRSFDGAFITGTSPKVLPVKAIYEVSFNPENTTINTIVFEYDIMIANDIDNFSWTHIDDQ